MKGIYVTLSDIMSIHGVKRAEASRIKNIIKDALGKEKHQELTIREFCEYEGILESDFRKAVNTFSFDKKE